MAPKATSTKRLVTLADVARYVNVSPRTVSQVLNGSENATTRVSEETARKVREAAEALKYRPSASARAMKGKGLRQVGFILEYEFLDGRVPPVIGMPAVLGIGDYLAEKDWNLSICREQRGGLGSSRLPRYLREHSVDGLILNSSSPAKDARVLEELRKFEIPHVVLNGSSPSNSICLDDVAGIQKALEHLIQLGHSRIVYVGKKEETHHSVGVRRNAYLEGMSQAGLLPQVWHYGTGSVAEQSEKSQISKRRAESRGIVEYFREKQPTAFLCYSDMDALHVSQALLGAGVRVPEDVSIVGYDDLPYVYLNHPALTTVRSEFYQLGWEAAKMLLQLVAEPSSELPSVVIQPEMIVRNSTCPPSS